MQGNFRYVPSPKNTFPEGGSGANINTDRWQQPLEDASCPYETGMDFAVVGAIVTGGASYTVTVTIPADSPNDELAIYWYDAQSGSSTLGQMITTDLDGNDLDTRSGLDATVSLGKTAVIAVLKFTQTPPLTKAVTAS